MLEQISELIEKFIDLFPHFDVTPETHATIAYRRGKAVLFKPGTMHWYWPIWTTLETLPVKRQTCNMPMQTLMTDEGLSFIIGGIIVYEVKDPLKACVEVHDVDEALRDMAHSAIRETFHGVTKDQLYTATSSTNKDLIKKLRASIDGMGLRIIKFCISDVSLCKTYRMVGDTDMVADEDDDE